VIGIEPGQPRYRILITDDTTDSRKLLVKLLEPFSFELREAANGQEAVEIWESWQPHLIWMDIRMPIMDGYDAVKKIRALEKPEFRTAIIAQTASTFEEERAVVLEAGCDDFLRKPFRATDIFELMRKHIGVRFVYSDVKETNDAKTSGRNTEISAIDFSDIPDDVSERLKNGAINADMDEVDTIIEEIRAIKPELAERLVALAVDFEYGKIARMIEKD